MYMFYKSQLFAMYAHVSNKFYLLEKMNITIDLHH